MATVNLGRIKPVFRGAYSGSTAYVVDDIVTSGNETYICIQAHGAGTQAVTVTAYWSKLAAKGGDVTQLTTQGDILYRDGSGVARLAAGASGQALLSGGAGANPSWGTIDLQGLKSDITALAIREATNENSAAFNLPHSFIETFTDDTNLGTETDGDRDSGSWQTIIPADGIDSNTVFMMHMDNALTDSSANNITVTNNGTATFNSGTKKFGTHSLELNGSSQWLSTGALNSGLTNAFPTTGDFTIDWWAAYDTRTGSNRHFSIGNDGSAASGGEPIITMAINHASNSDNVNYHGDVGVGSWGTDQTFSIGSPWTGFRHYAYQRTGTTSYAWIGGNVLANASTSSTHLSGDSLMQNDNNLFIGVRSNTSTEFFDGKIDEFRISSTSRYTGGTAFTPRTTAYSAIVANATGTLIQSANAVSGSRTSVGGTMCYKDAAGTNTLGTDLKIYFTANGGTNWTEAASYTAITPVYSTGIKMVKLGETTVTGGTDVRYKAVFANQASGSKEAQLHAIGINY